MTDATDPQAAPPTDQQLDDIDVLLDGSLDQYAVICTTTARRLVAEIRRLRAAAPVAPSAPVDRAGDVDRLQNKILELEADLAKVRDLLRTENQRANDAIDREETAEQAALEAQQDRAAVLREAADAVRRRAVHDGEDFCNGIDFAADYLNCMADEAQQPEEAWPSESQWRVEIYDPGAGQWMPAGTLTTKPEAEQRMALAAERAPKWRDDGTDVRRRIVRTTITYTVEAEAQRPEAPRCDVEFESGGRCAKPAGHWSAGSQDPHIPTP